MYLGLRFRIKAKGYATGEYNVGYSRDDASN